MLRQTPFRDWSIRYKLISLHAVTAALTALAICIALGVFDFLTLRRSIASDLTTLADVVARNSTAALSFADTKAAQDVLDAVDAESRVTAACIYAADGKAFVKYRRDGREHVWSPPSVASLRTEFKGGRLVVVRKINLQGDEIGTIYLESDLSALNRRVREYVITVVLTLAGALLLASLIASVLQRSISQPLGSLAKTAHAISQGRDYSIRAVLASRDEFGTLVGAFNTMLDQIEVRDRELRRHHDQLEEIVDARTRELVNANQQLSQAEEKYRTIFENAVVGIFQASVDGRPMSVNRAMAQMQGYSSPEEYLANVTNVAEQLFATSQPTPELTRILQGNGVVRDLELELPRKDKKKTWVLANVRAVAAEPGKATLIEGTLQDITDRKEAESRVQFLAFYDELTGLPNRTLLRDRLQKALAAAERRREKVALLFLDLDRFKIINDSLGHTVGDELLKAVAQRLQGWARAQDTVARIGGDEFLVVLTGVKQTPDAAIAAERIMDAMAAEFIVQGRKFNVNCSIGIGMFPDHGEDAETLIKNADAAMYCAKEDGRNAFQFFSEEMNAQVMQRLTLEHNLRSAIENRELSLIYQPQMEIATGSIVGVEALLRWTHPELGTVSTEEVIRVAENCGLILSIGEWALRTACSAACSWRELGLATPVAVNVSAVQFRHEDFPDTVAQVLKDAGLAPEYLELELTETLLLGNADLMVPVLQRLKRMGVRLAIDDFGTGYSSLSYLRYYPVNKLKIDRSFIKSVDSNSDDAAITAAIISMAKSLNLRVIAEGVENEAQMRFLREHNCDEIQGYYFSRPVPAERIPQLLQPVVPPLHAMAQAAGDGYAGA